MARRSDRSVPRDSHPPGSDDLPLTGHPCGIDVAILDSGLAANHPHLAGARVRGFSVVGDVAPFAQHPEFDDVTGHGTAVAAALHRMVPGASLLAVRVLDDELRCTTEALAAAIVLAADAGPSIINLSLGSGRADASEPLAKAIAYAADRGVVCVAAAHPRGRTLYPADLPGVISATTHRSCPLADLFAVKEHPHRFLAHGFPRPIEGRPPTENFFGPSFAAVHVSARVAALLSSGTPATAQAVGVALRAQCIGDWSDRAS